MTVEDSRILYVGPSRELASSYPADRVTYYANGNNVATVMVDRGVLIEDGVVRTVDESEVLEFTHGEDEAAMGRKGLMHLTVYTEECWDRSRY